MSFLRDIIQSEKDRWVLWLPMFLAGGIALYFALPFEPVWYAGVLLCGGAAGLLFFLWRSPERRFAGMLALALAIGFCLVQARAHMLSAPVLEKKTRAVMVSGKVSAVSIAGVGQRVLIENPSIAGFDKDKTPKKVRIKINGLKTRINEGDMISVKAVLMPPPMPAMPGAYDIPRKFWFEQLGGVGFAVSKANILAVNDSWDSFLGKIRSDINFYFLQALPKDEAGVAMSLVTGEQGGNSRKLANAYRDSGIAHMLSVSGLHMSMLSGMVFSLLRLFIAAFPFLALRYNGKKISAAVAIVVAFAYLLISGMAVPAQRAFIMVTVVLLAVIFDRQAISMRTIGFALLAVLLWHPEALVGASLQMSFAAVYALIAAYEAGAGKIRNYLHTKNTLSRLWRYAVVWLLGVLITDFVASSATTPFALYHFNRIASYSMLCNLLTGPILGVLVMPMLLLACLLMPFGLADMPLSLAGWGISLINDTAYGIAQMPHAVMVVPAMPLWGLLLMVIGGLWLFLWKQRWRYLGIMPIVIGLASPYFYSFPQVLAAQGGKLFAVMNADGKLFIEPGRANRINRESWLSRNGEDYNLYDKQAAEEAFAKGYHKDGVDLKCEGGWCRYAYNGKIVGIASDYDGLKAACKNAQVVFSKVNAKHEYCKAEILIERREMWKNGAYSLLIDEGGALKILNDAEYMGRRLWTP